MVVLEGSVSLVVGCGAETRELVRHRPRDLIAGLNMFLGRGRVARGVVRERESVLAIPGSEFRTLVERELGFGSFVLQTLLRRRQAFDRLQLGVRIIGPRFDRDTQRLREFAVRNRVLHEWIDIEDPRARASLAALDIGRETPVVLLDRDRFFGAPDQRPIRRGRRAATDPSLPIRGRSTWSS